MMIALLLAALAFEPSDSAGRLEFLRSSYKANKDAFVHGSFYFDYTKGFAASLADAEAESFSVAYPEAGFYAFDGKNARYEMVPTADVLSAATKWIDGKGSTSSLTAFRFLTDGEFTLRDQLGLVRTKAEVQHSPMIFPGTEVFYQHDYFEVPLYIGYNGKPARDLFTVLTAVQEGTLALKEVDANSEIDGVKVWKLLFEWRDGAMTYWVDVNRGSIPIRILERYNPNNVESVIVFSDLVQTANGAWFPRRKLHSYGHGSQLIDRIVVTRIDTAKPPPSVFQLDFPEPTAMVDEARNVIYPPRKTWSLLHLPSASSPGVRKSVARSYIPPPELPGEVLPGPSWIMVSSVAVGVLIILGAIAAVVSRNRGPREA